MQNILFRADGNSTIGLGHVYRCMAIAHRLQKKYNCFFAIRNPLPELASTIQNNFNIIILKEYENYVVEAEDVVKNIFPKYNFAIITLDGYCFDTPYQKTIKNNCTAALICIDDDQPFHYVADAVINHAWGLSAAQISAAPYTKFFIGKQFLLVNKSFIESFKNGRTIVNINSALVCFGGADPNNLTLKIVNYLQKINTIQKITVVLGASYLYTNKLQKVIAKNKNFTILQNISSTKILQIMKTTELAIVPSSTISVEAFSAKMILIAGTIAQNQKYIYKGLSTEDNVVGVGNFEHLNFEHFSNSILIAQKKFKNYFIPASVNKDAVLKVYQSLNKK